MDGVRRRLVGSAAIALFGISVARSEPALRVMRVVVVPTSDWSGRTEEQRQGSRETNARYLAEEGFVEGRNVALEFVDIHSPDRTEVERRARAVIASRPAVILVGGDYVDQFARLTKEIPIVFYYMGYDPLRAGFVESYSRPGGNVTGIMFYPPGRESKSWELLRELAPGAKRIGVVYYEDEPTGPWIEQERESTRATASVLGLELVRIVIPRNVAYPVVERAIRKAKIDVMGGVDGSASWIADHMRFLEQSRIPAIWNNPEAVRRGGLLSCQPSWDGQYRTAVTLVAQVLRGANPATLPVQAPTRYMTAINLRTARAMGLTIPPSILLRADLVIE